MIRKRVLLEGYSTSDMVWSPMSKSNYESLSDVVNEGSYISVLNRISQDSVEIIENSILGIDEDSGVKYNDIEAFVVDDRKEPEARRFLLMIRYKVENQYRGIGSRAPESQRSELERLIEGRYYRKLWQVFKSSIHLGDKVLKGRL
jgi:hypothetical protein